MKATIRAALLASIAGLVAVPALAQSGDAATIAELRRQLDEMRRRLEQLEARQAPATQAQAAQPARREARAARAAPPVAAAPAAEAQAAAAEARAAAAEARLARTELAEAERARTAPIQGLEAPEAMGRDFVTEEALRSDLPGIAFRVPGTDTQVRLYGFAKVTTWSDFNARNQSDAPAPSLIPLRGSREDLQGGDYGFAARFSRFGVDSRTLTPWGTLETRIEGDFGGGAPTSSNALFRLRQAWAELGTERFSVLIGQANSLWNEGLFETMIDATNLNQSFIRQAQIRVSGRLAPGLQGQFSIEAPETNVVSGAGTFNPGSTVANGASPSFNSMPDFHGRLTYRNSGWEVGLRGMLRDLSFRPEGTGIAGDGQRRNTTGWGFALHGRMPLRAVWDGFGRDELVAMGYYGEGIGRYFFGNTGGQDAVSNFGLPSARLGLSLDPLPTYGATIAYRRFWTDQLRSNFSYSWARQDYPSYVQQFTPGSALARSLNREVQQVFANIIWSPFATSRNGAFSQGWLDVGLEYLFTRRDIAGGGVAGGGAGQGTGIANRLLFGAVARF
jgi:nucleoid-associated protein YgaU